MRLEDEMLIVGSHAQGKLLAGAIDRIGVVLFNQPEKRNAVSLEMWDGVCSALDRFAADDAIRVVVIAGSGGQAFSSGNDISQFAERRASAEANAAYARTLARGWASLAGTAKPTVACIEGYCVGGGLATALLADVRVAARESVFGIPAARLGIAYSFEATERLVSTVGPSRARLLLYTARRLNGEEAHDIGLVDVLADDAATECIAMAHTIASNAPLSVQAAKFHVAQTLAPADQRDHTRMQEITRRCMDSADYREGREAFMGKRPPVFTGM